MQNNQIIVFCKYYPPHGKVINLLAVDKYHVVGAGLLNKLASGGDIFAVLDTIVVS